MSFATGNIVLYCGSYYIVKEEQKNSKGERQVALMPIDYSNSTSYPSESWPDNPKHRVDSIKFVASTVADFIQNNMVRFLDKLAEHEVIEDEKRILITDLVLNDTDGDAHEIGAGETITIINDEEVYWDGDVELDCGVEFIKENSKEAE